MRLLVLQGLANDNDLKVSKQETDREIRKFPANAIDPQFRNQNHKRTNLWFSAAKFEP